MANRYAIVGRRGDDELPVHEAMDWVMTAIANPAAAALPDGISVMPTLIFLNSWGAPHAYMQVGQRVLAVAARDATPEALRAIFFGEEPAAYAETPPLTELKPDAYAAQLRQQASGGLSIGLKRTSVSAAAPTPTFSADSPMVPFALLFAEESASTGKTVAITLRVLTRLEAAAYLDSQTGGGPVAPGALIRLGGDGQAAESRTDRNIIAYASVPASVWRRQHFAQAALSQSAHQAEEWRSRPSAVDIPAALRLPYPPLDGNEALQIRPTEVQVEGPIAIEAGHEAAALSHAVALAVAESIARHTFGTSSLSESDEGAVGNVALVTWLHKGSGDSWQLVAVPTATVTGSGVAFGWMSLPQGQSRLQRRPASAPQAASPAVAVIDGSDMRTCPNCGTGIEPTGAPGHGLSRARPVSYVAIARYAQAQQKAAKRAMEALIPPTIPALPQKRKDGRTVLAPRPRSARHASYRPAVAELATRPDAPCFAPGHHWTSPPPVLARLTVDVEEILFRPIWAQRTIYLCEQCAELFEPAPRRPSPSPPRRNTVFEGSAIVSPSTADLKVSRETTPPCLHSNVIDCIALTDLQASHRRTRRAEREKYEMRCVVRDCAGGSAAQNAADLLNEEVHELVTGFSCVESAITTADAALAHTLCSELYRAMLHVTSLPPEPELGAVVSKPKHAAAAQAAVIPPPSVLVEVHEPGSRNSPVQAMPIPHAEAPRVQSRAAAMVSRLSYTFSQLRGAEQRLIIDTVGRDKQHVAGLCLGRLATADEPLHDDSLRS
jgi:hypothetical protein